MQRMTFKIANSLFGVLGFFLTAELQGYTLLSGQELDPGIGIYHVSSTYVQDPGATYIASFNAQGGSSEIVVTGPPATAFIDQGILQIQLNNADYTLNQPYTILEADGGLSGEFGSIFSNFNSALVASPSYRDTLIFLTLATDFEQAARSNNQRQVGRVLDDNQNAQGDFLRVIQNALEVSEEQLPCALDELSGQQYTSVFQIARLSTNRFLRDLFDPLLFGIDGACEEGCTDSGCAMADCCEDGDLEMWGTAHYGRAFLDGDCEGRGYKSYSLDALLALQKPLSDCFKVGLAAFYEHTEVDYNLNGDANVNSIQAALYGIYQNDCYYALADLTWGFQHFNFRRKIEFNMIDRIARGKPKVYDAALYGEWGYNFYLANCLNIQPFFGVEGGTFWFSSFHEKDARSVNLSVKDKRYWLCDTRLGVRVNALLPCEMLLSLNVAWDHAFCEESTKLNCHFEGVGQEFQVHGAKPKSNAVEGSLYFSKKVFSDTTVFAEAAGQASSNSLNYSFVLGIDFSI